MCANYVTMFISSHRLWSLFYSMASGINKRDKKWLPLLVAHTIQSIAVHSFHFASTFGFTTKSRNRFSARKLTIESGPSVQTSILTWILSAATRSNHLDWVCKFKFLSFQSNKKNCLDAFSLFTKCHISSRYFSRFFYWFLKWEPFAEKWANQITHSRLTAHLTNWVGFSCRRNCCRHWTQRKMLTSCGNWKIC